MSNATRILVAGASGQLARALALAGGDRLVVKGRPVLDLCDPASVRAAIDQAKPDVVINAAADTDVEGAEDDPHPSRRVNVIGAEHLALEAARAGAAFIQVSTDFVFDGRKGAPYVETDAINPLNAYGRLKLEGEQRCLAANSRTVVVRTAWVFSPWSRNFVRTMLRLAQERDVVSVVDDQKGSPTSAADLAVGLLAVAARLAATEKVSAGVLHLASPEAGSWADLAEATFAESLAVGGPSATVNRIASADFPQKALRPADSRLDGALARRLYGIELASWRASLPGVVAALIRDMKSPA